jgi:hypothetical protein
VVSSAPPPHGKPPGGSPDLVKAGAGLGCSHSSSSSSPSLETWQESEGEGEEEEEEEGEAGGGEGCTMRCTSHPSLPLASLNVFNKFLILNPVSFRCAVCLGLLVDSWKPFCFVEWFQASYPE